MKEILKTFLETIRGINNEGSSKRATAFGLFWVNAILAGCYGFAYVYSATRTTAQLTRVHDAIIDQFPYVAFLFLSSMLTCLGLTTWEIRSRNKKEVELKKAEASVDKKEE